MSKRIGKVDRFRQMILQKYAKGVSAKEIASVVSSLGVPISDTGIRKYLLRNGVCVRTSSEARTLLNLSPWNEGKTYKQKNPYPHRSENMKGEKNHAWQGGLTEKHALIRNSAEYAEWRKSVLERDNYTCVFCGIKSKVGTGRVPLEVDHILPFASYIDLRFEISNGRTLCRECHKKTPTYGRNLRYAPKVQI